MNKLHFSIDFTLRQEQKVNTLKKSDFLHVK